jgi:hypothetical protein
LARPGADADEVLLGDADVDQPVRELLAEADEVARADGVVATATIRSSSRASSISVSAKALRQS